MRFAFEVHFGIREALLSKGDEAMLNRLTPLNKGREEELFPARGRLSGFSKTMWAYSLRDDFYDPRECVKDHLRFDGTWKTATTVDTCHNFPIGHEHGEEKASASVHSVEAIFAD